MTKLCNKNRRESTMVRDNEIHELYQQIRHELGSLANAVSKGYIYERIKEKTKLSIRTISFILNHTNWVVALMYSSQFRQLSGR